MPIYVYKNKETGEVKDVFRPASQYKDPYLGEDGSEEGLWDKVIVSASINTTGSTSNIDPHSKEEFLAVTRDKKGSLGDLYDLSEELSQKRAEKNGGVDPVKEEAKKAYEERTGAKLITGEEQESITHEGIKIEFDD